MVYLDDLIKKYKSELLADESLQAICYFFISDKQRLPKTINPNLGDEETLAIKGYLGFKPSEEEIQVVIGRKPIKQLDYTKNIFKLLGIYLSASEIIADKVATKFIESPLKYKYLISKLIPAYQEKLVKDLGTRSPEDSPYYEFLSYILLNQSYDDMQKHVANFVNKDVDIIDLLIIEDLQQQLIMRDLSIHYRNLTAKDLVKQVLEQFGNAVKKITHDRRKAHSVFEINDEYDVQDLLYVMLKPVFPKLLIEDPTPKVGFKHNKIDLEIREEKILIEVKMIKRGDDDEKIFIEGLKNDIQSYYLSQYLEYLLIYVYDPQNKTRDLQNFYALNGEQEIKGKRFTVEVTVGN